MANVMERRRKAQQKAKALKRLQMAEPGYESRYHKRKEARARGEPMATRTVMPWWFTEFSAIFNRIRPEVSAATA